VASCQDSSTPCETISGILTAGVPGANVYLCLLDDITIATVVSWTDPILALWLMCVRVFLWER
jgi:hypothetical protein